MLTIATQYKNCYSSKFCGGFGWSLDLFSTEFLTDRTFSGSHSSFNCRDICIRQISVVCVCVCVCVCDTFGSPFSDMALSHWMTLSVCLKWRPVAWNTGTTNMWFSLDLKTQICLIHTGSSYTLTPSSTQQLHRAAASRTTELDLMETNRFFLSAAPLTAEKQFVVKWHIHF